MKVDRDQGRLRISGNAMEARVLRHILDAIITNYRTPPDQMDPKAAAAWYSTRGCQTAGLSAEDTRDWLEQLHGYRSANLALLEDCAAQLARRAQGRRELRVPLDQAEALLTAFNDHRLLLAARHDIGQEEMDLPGLHALRKLSSERQLALFEIHFLAWLIGEMLRLIAPEAASWQD